MQPVLIVEDDPDIATLVEYRLRKHGYDTVTAVNGAEAVSVLETVRPRVIVTDWSMPILSGLEMCALIRGSELDPQPYLIMITARTAAADRRQATLAGIDDYLPKPISFPELLQIVDAAFAA